MIDFSHLTSISANDSRRLQDSFFQTTPKKTRKKDKRKIVLISIFSLSLASIIAVIFIVNYHVIILPSYNAAPANLMSLFDPSLLSSALPLKAPEGSRIDESYIYITIPYNKKSGFTINLREKIDLSNATLTLVVKNPESTFKTYTILRDVNYFSNSRSPLETTVETSDPATPYLEIPIAVAGIDIPGPFNIHNITQIRFLFHQENKETLPLLVKNAFVRLRK